MKRVLITAGPVYGRLDDNKLVSNRTRGIWATKFAEYLMGQGYQITLLLADTTSAEVLRTRAFGSDGKISVERHNGYDDYAAKCDEFARTHDAAVMAAAVVNWIPQQPFPGKMPTKGFQEGDTIQVPFVLAPRVINRMRRINPRLTLIGCKMLVGSDHETLIEAAYDVLLTAKCNVVLANDLTGLRAKHLVYQDRTVVSYDDSFNDLFAELRAVIDDQHFRTVETDTRIDTLMHIPPETLAAARARFDAIVDIYRARFIHRSSYTDHVFGAVAVPCGPTAMLISPREKSHKWTSNDAVIVTGVSFEDRTVTVLKRDGKATLNAPLLVRMQATLGGYGILHLHEQLPGVPTEPYAPPGTIRDSNRKVPGRVFNIEGHGFVACLGKDLNLPA